MKEKLIEYVKNHIDEDYDPAEDELTDYLDSVSFLQYSASR